MPFTIPRRTGECEEESMGKGGRGEEESCTRIQKGIHLARGKGGGKGLGRGGKKLRVVSSGKEKAKMQERNRVWGFDHENKEREGG